MPSSAANFPVSFQVDQPVGSCQSAGMHGIEPSSGFVITQGFLYPHFRVRPFDALDPLVLPLGRSVYLYDPGSFSQTAVLGNNSCDDV